jgi:hypothetical protein
MIFKSKFLLSILNCEADFGTISVDDAVCGAQERSTQDNGCPYISTCVQNHEVYGYIQLSDSYTYVFKNSLRVVEWLIYKLQMLGCI